MSRYRFCKVVCGALLIVLLVGCTTPAPTATTASTSTPTPENTGGPEQTSGGIPADAALKITGKVDAEVGWTEEQVRAMDTIEAQSTNKSGETSTYTGVLIADLLNLAGVQSDATTLVFVADDGYTAEAALAEVQGCADCIVSFRNQGGFSIVMPGFAGNLQVKGVVEMQVK